MGDTDCVLFDFDGTLACSTPAIVESYRFAFTEVLGYPFPDSDEDMNEMLTVRFRELCANRGGDRAQDLVTKFRERYLGELESPPHLYDGVLEMFDGLRERGITFGMVTNKTRVAAEHEILRCGLGDTEFRCLITADEASRGKPDPLPVVLGLQAAGVEPDKALYVGDGGHDVVAARGAGVRAVGAAYGDWGAEALRTAGAYAVIDAPLGLLDVVDAGLR
ncbi:MAG TPA: HAD hydrolase-like protein [Pseudonocardia sp.]|nr:HAD hydrolase-like protein [Pseudonocardia sp.]